MMKAEINFLLKPSQALSLMNNLLKNSLIFMTIILLLSSLIACDGECEELPDLVIPEFVTGKIPVAIEYNYTVLAGIDYPNGTGVSLENTVNEFYSVTRYDQWANPIVFYWNVDSPPPFYWGAPAPNNLLQAGEQVTVHKCVLNQGRIDFDCLLNTAEASKTKFSVRHKVVNGEIVDEQVVKEDTPSIPAGEYRVVSFPLTIKENGSYEFRFKANADNTIAERDTTNNELLEFKERLEE